MLKEKKITLQAPDYADVCKRSRSATTLDVEFEEFEAELLAAIELEEKQSETALLSAK
ncbi:hypothetical protein [Paenibacillus sp. FSL R7-0273]|uniref:hypothetical protein n=1 Tax=Paenibacillus sp. FSL R7-0273 TaxID=1536772 RepID=UPI000ABB516A|nr:hypothetical protein [Paenibacillus sp. FSL R7-0273]